MAHDVLAKTIDAMLHVQFPDPWRDLLHLLVVALLTTHSRRRDVGIHGRRNMRTDGIHAMQSVEDFWSGNDVGKFTPMAGREELTRRCISLNAIRI